MHLTLHSVPWLICAAGALCGTVGGRWAGAAWPLCLGGFVIGLFVVSLS